MSLTDAFQADLAKSTGRVLHFGVSHGDLRRAAAAGDWEGWSEVLEEIAERYEEAAGHAAVAGCRLSAAEGWCRAAVYYHYAQLKLRGGARKNSLQARCRESYAKGAGWLDPPARRIEVRFAGSVFPGYLRSPAPQAPCVLLINGLDSAKEVELAFFAQGFLRRGNAVLTLDGPGQGEAGERVSMHRFAPMVSAALDALSGVPGIDRGPFGIFGVSFGGFLACQAAASDPRLAACASLGGFHDSRVFARLPAPALDNLRRAYGLAAGADVAVLDGVVTLAPLRGRMDRPLLIVHGTADHLVDADQVRALTAWAGPAVETLIYEGAEHVCTDRFGECLPRLWDWMTLTLSAAAARVAVA